eukprot:925608-Amphidinium_carterae.1
MQFDTVGIAQVRPRPEASDTLKLLDLKSLLWARAAVLVAPTHVRFIVRASKRQRLEVQRCS